MKNLKDFKIFMPVFFTIVICLLFLAGYLDYRVDVKSNIDLYNKSVNNYSNVVIESENIQNEVNKYNDLVNKYNELVNDYNSYKNSYPDDIDKKIEDLRNSIN